MEWKEVFYSKSNTNMPVQRWGHRMVCTKSNELVLFGGFGGSPLEGKYLDDIWSFSITNCAWQQVITTGPLPESRSNYTLHYDHINNDIILFGGSSDHKTRSNSVTILNWTTKMWTKHLPPENSEAPWERTYHSSQFLHPYLIVYGGEGVFGQDLDDMWAYNIQMNRWSRITFKESDTTPKKRRFHSTALINNHFYLMGGCTESYALLGDMYKVNLEDLFQKDRFSDYSWECVCSDSPILSRWGHTSLVYDQKIFIVGGKINGGSDNEYGVSFDPCSKVLARLPIKQGNILPPRRRHASAVVGNSLLVFGGFNGKYLNDFYYLALNNIRSLDFQLIAVDDRNDILQQLDKCERKLQSDIIIKLIKNGKVEFHLKSNKKQLQLYQFFANMLQFSPNENHSIELPFFCDIATFRLIHLCLMEKQMLFCPKLPIQFWINLMFSFEYFVCIAEMQAFSRQLTRLVSNDNCLQLLQVATELGLEDLKRTAAEIYWLNHDDIPHKNRCSDSTIETNYHIQCTNIEELVTHYSRSEKEPHSFAPLEQIYETIKFDVEQKKLKSKSSSFFLKGAKKFKSVLKRKPTQAGIPIENQQSRAQEVENVDESPPGCFQRFVTFLAGICKSSDSHE